MTNTSKSGLRKDGRRNEAESTLLPMLIGGLVLAIVGMTVIVFFV